MEMNEKSEKCILFLATQKGYFSLKSIIGQYKNNIACVVSFSESYVEESFDVKIQRLCLEYGIIYKKWGDIKDKLEDIIDEMGVSFAIAISWRYLIPLDINVHLKHNLIVFHDSLLPKYRGFSPTPTAIIKGESTIGISVIYASDDIDNGNIIFQKSMRVSRNEYIKHIIKRQSQMYAELLIKIFEYITNGWALPECSQNDEEATYSIWRSVEDCKIDWEKSSEEIYNLIRAVGNPYPGAYTYYNGNKVIIEEAEVCHDRVFEIRQAGKIWKISKGCPEVICGKGMLIIKKSRFENGEIAIFDKLRIRMG